MLKTKQSENLFIDPIEKVRIALCDIREGRSRALRDESALFENLEKILDTIFSKANGEESIELLARFLQTDKILSEVKNEDAFLSLYEEAVFKFVEIAEEYSGKDFLKDILHDLIVRNSGCEGYRSLFWEIDKILPENLARELFDEAFETIESHELDNKKFAEEALLDLAEGINNPAAYERVLFLIDEERSVDSLLDAANFYAAQGKLTDAKRLLFEVKNPSGQELEDYIDIQVSIAEQEGKKDDAKKLAVELYERFPSEMNLARTASLLSETDRRALFKNHEKFRLGKKLSAEYLQILAGYNEYRLIEECLDAFGNEQLTLLSADALEILAEELDNASENALAKRIRDWTVEEPEDLTEQ